MEQAGESIMGRGLLLVALYFRRLGRAHRAWRGNHEVDVVIVRTLGRVHALFLLHFLQLRNLYWYSAGIYPVRVPYSPEVHAQPHGIYPPGIFSSGVLLAGRAAH